MQQVEGLAAAERRLLELAARSSDASVWLNLGATQHALNKLELASDSFRRAIELAPQSPVGYCARATVLSALGRNAQAEQLLRQAPEDAQVHFNLAVLLEARGDKVAAREHYERALTLDARHGGARLNLGAMKLDAGEAADALQDFDAAAAQAPSADTHVNRARALLALFRDEEALRAVQAALTIDPRHKGALLERVAALASLGRLEEAERAMPSHDEVAAELRARGFDRPPRVRDLYLARAFERQFTCNWRDRDELIGLMRESLDVVSDGAMPFNALSLPLSGAEQRALGNSVAKALPATGTPFHTRARSALRETIRVGILSANIARHPEGYLLRRVLSDLDRRRYEVRLYGLNTPKGDILEKQLQTAADAFVDASAMATPQIVQGMRADELDLVVDASGYLRGARPEVLKARVAPVQASYLSIPATLGGGLVDYRISDAWTTPREAQGDWAEKLVLLPPPFWVYDNAIRAAPAGTRRSQGLPDAGLVLCCMNQAFKIEPEVFGVWMRVLGATPGAVLWLLDEGALVRENLRREARARGIAPERLVFAPRMPLAPHLGRLAHADLFLDTFYCNAHTTAIDALWAGVPALTRRGETMASRLASTFVRSAGLDELVVDSTEEYERKATQLARDAGAIARLKQTLAQATYHAPLFDTTARVRALERAFTAMVERHRAGLPPDTLIIE